MFQGWAEAGTSAGMWRVAMMHQVLVRAEFYEKQPKDKGLSPVTTTAGLWRHSFSLKAAGIRDGKSRLAPYAARLKITPLPASAQPHLNLLSNRCSITSSGGNLQNLCSS